ncbi:MAG: AEC family transporter [Treponemataceae bacterium]
MNYFGMIFGKILFIGLMMAMGIVVKRTKVVSDAGDRDISRLMVDFTWPALVFASINTSLTAADIIDNIALPLLSIALHLVGFFIGLVICLVTKYSGNRRKVFLFHVTMNNFLLMALPFVQIFLPGKGTALLTVSNLGSTFVLWTLGVILMSEKVEIKTILKLVFSPVMVTTLVSVLFVLTGFNKVIPSVVYDVGADIGKSTLFLGLLIAGTQINKMGFHALKFNQWNILVGLVRNIVVPAIVFGFCLLFQGTLPKEVLIIIMLVSIAPASVNSITLALRYESDPKLATEGVLFTHLFALPTMLGFLLLMDRFLLA